MLEILFVVTGVLVVAGAIILLLRSFKGRRYEITSPELRNRALKESERLAELVDERRTGQRDGGIAFHEEELQRIYQEDHLPRVASLKDHFAERRIRNEMLEELYDSAENEADLRTISTALQEMSGRLKR